MAGTGSGEREQPGKTIETGGVNEPSVDPQLEALNTKASSALLSKETNEGREKMDIRKMSYIHIEDGGYIRENAEQKLKDELGMDKKLGEAENLEDAKDLLERLAAKGEPVNLILVDRSFPDYADEIDDRLAGDKLIKHFAKKMAEDPRYQQAFKDAYIILMSSYADDPEEMKKIGSISDRVIGGISDKASPSKALEQALRDAQLIE